MAAVNAWQKLGLSKADYDSIMGGQDSSSLIAAMDQPAGNAPIDGLVDRGPAAKDTAIDQDQVQTIPGMDFGPPAPVVSAPPAPKAFVGPPAPSALPPAPIANKDSETPQTHVEWMAGPSNVDLPGADAGISLPSLFGFPKGSGLGQKASTNEQGKSGDVKQTLLTMSPEEFSSAQKNVLGSPAFQDQQEGLDNLRQMAAQVAARPTQVDLSPLAALTDSWTGSNLSKGYQRPETGDQRIQQAMAAAQKLQADQANLSKEALNTVIQQKGGFLNQYQQLLMNNALESTANDPLKALRGMNPAQQTLALNRQIQGDLKPLQDANTQLQEAQRLLGSQQSFADTVSRDKIAKALIGGRLSNYDQQNVNGNTSAMGRVDNLISKLENGTFSTVSRAEINDAIKIMQAANASEANIRLNRFKGIGSGIGLPDEMLSPLVDPAGWGFGSVGQATLNKIHNNSNKVVGAAKNPGGVGGGPGGSMSFEQWKASQGK